ncbi:MAG: hypothetical protein J6A95_03995 [Clostridia bacterium]|nr:hypothetical protein [Clostridia bacterium]
MKSIIRELWQYKINPSVEVNTITPEIKGLYTKIEIAEEKITANFTKEQKQALEDYTDLYCECSSILQEIAFTYGMRLGIKILLDALTNN